MKNENLEEEINAEKKGKNFILEMTLDRSKLILLDVTSGSKYNYNYSKSMPSITERAEMVVRGLEALNSYLKSDKAYPNLIKIIKYDNGIGVTIIRD